MSLTRCAVLAAVFALPSALFGDYRYEETTTITGGTILKLAKLPGMGKMTAPATTTHYFKGGKSASVTGKQANIVDADQGIFLAVNHEDKTFSRITFEEFKAALEAISQKARQQGKFDGEVAFDVSVRDLGTSRKALNMDAKGMEMKLTMTMKDKKSGQAVPMDITSELYLVKDLPGAAEMREFYARMAKKLAWDMRNMRFMGMAQMQPGMAEGMQKMAEEAQKLEGVPLITVTRMMGMAGLGDMPDLSGAPGGAEIGDAVQREAANEAAREAAWQTSRASGGRFGGLAGAAAGGMLGGFGKKKPKEEPKAEPKPASQPAGPQPFLEATSEIVSYGGDPIPESTFAVPTGYKEVEHDMKKALRNLK